MAGTFHGDIPPGVFSGSGADAGFLPLDDLVYVATQSVLSITIARYVIVGAATVVVYDWLLNLDKEMEFIHRSRWSLVKIAYLCAHPEIIHVELPTRWALVLLSVGLLILVIIMLEFFVATLESVGLLFVLLGRSGCFSSTDQDSGIGSIHLGVLFSYLVLFDSLNIAIVVRHCIVQRSLAGELGRTMLKQGIVYYTVTTFLNTISTIMYFWADRRWTGLGSWLAFVLPSVMSCRLVLMLRRKASPTDSEVQGRVNRVIEEDLEMMSLPFDERARDNLVGLSRRPARHELSLMQTA
ncbi:hypothetical protein K488DRAFT_81963 [Vararia minispora EC-137]|uniref:Uncharacterized protein n=1 Tax=Vararia minispora EC-137 TaxID=1314806 RepID=A0ACB8QX83_9AGAM|nr:hypothetical protein K488DRAFT_81963 [Vararia minispora EC-137]